MNFISLDKIGLQNYKKLNWVARPSFHQFVMSV